MGSKKKDFTNDIKSNNGAFEGQGVSQTYKERAAAKEKDTKKNEDDKQNAKAENEGKSVAPNKEDEKQETKRITLYLPERLYKRLSMVAAIEETSMNKIIVEAIEKEVTDERVKTALNQAANLA